MSHAAARAVRLAGYNNGDVKLFDLRTNKVRWLAHAALFANCSADSSDVLALPHASYACEHPSCTAGGVRSQQRATFQPKPRSKGITSYRMHGMTLPYAAAGSVGSLQLRWETNVKNGVCGVSFDRRDIPMNKFIVTCLESVFHVYDARTHNPSKVSILGRPLAAALGSVSSSKPLVLSAMHRVL